MLSNSEKNTLVKPFLLEDDPEGSELLGIGGFGSVYKIADKVIKKMEIYGSEPA